VLRLSITAYLTLVSLLGPGLCCCTAVRLVTSAPCRHGAHRQQANRDCCHHRHSHGHGRPDEPSQPCGEQPGCPCNDHHKIPVALAPGDGNLAGLEKLAPSVGPLPALPTTAGLSAGACPIASVEPGGNVARSGRDILRALHVLRC
jgi:hypothetical protein